MNQSNVIPAQATPNPTADNPALSLQLRGLHLIEASAGTGKTWTLSALIVRLILEGDCVPRQMIATTFTRAAAAELRARIRQRLEQVRRVIKQLLAAREAQAKKPTDPQLCEAAEVALAMVQAEIEADLFLAYLIQRIQAGKFGSTDHAIAKNGWAHCLNRLDLALQGFDELFVGTLDSFCQKLLSEFAFESGQGERLQITEQEQELCAEILHDAVRRWRSQQDPRLIALLLQTKRLHDGTAYQYSVSTVMNFLSAQLAPVTMPSLDFSRLEQIKSELLAVDIAVFEQFLSPNGALYHRLYKSRALYNNGHLFRAFIQKIRDFGVVVLLGMKDDEPETKLLEGFNKLDTNFSAKNSDAKQQFSQLNGLALLQEIAQIRTQLYEKMDQVEQQLTFVLSQTVRERLPILLAERGETSFSQQMRLLANALDDPDNGATLAQQIRHRYPVALVDEFQDTNTDQDRVIARVYRSQPLDPAVCLILVGDPKQAIYGFRGGDVQTYLQVRAEIQHAQRQGQGRLHGLTVNHRSIASLVQAVNGVFLRNTTLGDGIDYPDISAGDRAHPSLSEQVTDSPPTLIDNPSPLRLIALDDGKQESPQIAWRIMQLLAQAAQGQLLLKGKPLQAEHIAVLGFSNRELDQVQNLLHMAKIPVWRPSRCSVFASPIARDLAALLQLLLTPYREQRLRRALSGPLVGWDLARLDQLDTDAQLLARQQMAFADDGQVWARQGFLAAWQRIAERLNIWTHVASQPEAERHLVNLRHLLELLHEHSEHSGGTHHLLSWLLRQINQPKTREWEMERRLPSQSGVQLMTIHASKGLEFPVVFVQGLDRRRKKKSDVVFYLKPPVGQRAPQRVLGFNDQTEQHLVQHHARVEAEYRRLAYVALTRASHRLYLPLLPTDKKLSTDSYAAILSYWLAADLPEWIAEQADRVQLESVLDAAPSSLSSQVQNLSAGLSADVTRLVARPVPKRRLNSWGMTSFSAMIREYDARQSVAAADQTESEQETDEISDESLLESLPEKSFAVVESSEPAETAEAAAITERAGTAAQQVFDPPSSIEWAGFDESAAQQDELADQSADWAGFDEPAAESMPLDAPPGWMTESEPSQFESSRDQMDDWSESAQEATDALLSLESAETVPVVNSVWFDFPRGITSGNCLHKILEYIDPSQPKDWVNTFDKQMKAHGINGVDPAAMLPWFEHIVQAKLPAGATLASIGFRERVREMDFHLALPSGEIDGFRLLARLARSGLHVPQSLRQTHAVRYLKGSIDLVYRHAGRFYVADYKSNSLSKRDSLDDYALDNMQAAMDHAGYWLQAALYLVALHRYLKIRLPGYQIEQHLGGAHYLFLRGMRAGDAEHGILTWQPEPALIEDLDAILLGSAQHD